MKELSMEELMIGDYIRTIFSQKIVKVKEIKQSCIYTEGNGYEYNEIEPIPLTSEILEKNGFVKQNFDGWEYIHPDDSTFSYIDYRILWRTDYDNHLLIRKYKESNIFATLQISCINYIHQLQHALRLCEIEKEIIL